MPLSNCKRCGSLFSRTTDPVCPECIKKEEVDFEKAVAWLRENPGKTIQTLSEETGIDQQYILRWIRSKRITVSEGGGGLVKCKKCGATIPTGNYCDHCRLGLSLKVDEGLRAMEKEKQSPPKQKHGMHYRPFDRERKA